ncbi:hypothetical protein PROFUN_06936, partial [Planoprotostelium fungivorum]
EVMAESSSPPMTLSSPLSTATPQGYVEGTCNFCHCMIRLAVPQRRKQKKPNKEKWAWTEDLHAMFLAAFDDCKARHPNKKPTATSILQRMIELGAPPSLKRTAIASHCQKFEKKLAQREGGTDRRPLSVQMGDAYFGRMISTSEPV